MMQDAVAKNFEVLGESAGQLSSEIIGHNPQIPWNDMVGLRHRLVHHYGGTDWTVVRETVQLDLPLLLDQLTNLLKQMGEVDDDP